MGRNWKIPFPWQVCYVQLQMQPEQDTQLLCVEGISKHPISLNIHLVLVYRWWRVDICTWSNLLTERRCSHVLLCFWPFTFPFWKKKIHWKISSRKSCTVFTHSVYFHSIWPFHQSSSMAQLFILVITVPNVIFVQWRLVFCNMIQNNIKTIIVKKNYRKYKSSLFT